MAVAIASHLLARRINLPVDKLEQAGYRIVSAGTAGLSGGNATVQARTAVEELNCPMGKHQSQPLTIDLIEESDLIYVMTHSHHCTILEWAPQAEQRTKLLDPSGRDISDPIGSPLETYRQCARRIKSLVEKRLPEIMRKKP
jgi:protein-tyrosine-phosphatase